MTKQMQELFDSLKTKKVKNLASAYDYVGQSINDMDMNGTYAYDMTASALKNVEKDYKTLKKIYKGKLDITPDSVYKKYNEDTSEHFVLMCIVILMRNNSF